MFRIFLFICLLTMLSYSADAKLNLNKAIPGGSDPVTDGERVYEGFTAEHALVNIRRIASALDSFTKLTKLSDNLLNTMTKAEYDKIGNTDWDIQNNGFGNWVEVVNGTILKQEYLIKKLKYELAQERYKSGVMSKRDVAKAKKEFEEGEKTFQKFWDDYQILD